MTRQTFADGAWKFRFEAMVKQGSMPEVLARVALARRIVSITLTVWKKGERVFFS